MGAAALAAAPLWAQPEWPMYQADAAHRGASQVDPRPASMALRWRVQLATSRLNPISVAAGRVFASNAVYFQSASLWAVDTSDGTVAWEAGVGAPFSVNPASYAGGRVYMQTCNHSSDTYLHCRDAATGQRLFSAPFQAQWERYQAPTVVDGVAYFNGGYYGGMYAVDAVTGQQLWFTSLPQYDEWTPAVDADHAYAFVGGDLYALRRNDGQQAFRIHDPGWSWSGWSSPGAVVLGDQQDAFVTSSGRLVRFDLVSRTVSYEVPGGFAGQPAFAHDAAYGLRNGELTAVEQASGQVLWSWRPTSSTLTGEVLLSASHAFVRDNSSTYMVDLSTQTAAWTWNESGYLAIDGGALYIARADGSLTCVGFAALPAPQSVSPARSPYGDPSPTVTLRGSGFAQGTTATVMFGQTAATQVVVVNDQTITCVPPASGPGVVDVVVETVIGRGVLPSGYAFTPAMTAPTMVRRGGTVDLEYHVHAGDTVLAALSAPPGGSIAMPPLRGALCLDPGSLFVILAVPSWPFERFRAVIDIPDDPALVGASVLAQAVAGSSLAAPPFAGAWTNCIQFTIQ
ncbi:MAG: PQQ-binding-like beta-propeller repeat protein [Planctomycetota bacterium]